MLRKLQTEKTNAEKPSKEEDKKDKVSEIAVTKEICETEMVDKSNTKELSKDMPNCRHT